MEKGGPDLHQLSLRPYDVCGCGAALSCWKDKLFLCQLVKHQFLRVTSGFRTILHPLFGRTTGQDGDR